MIERNLLKQEIFKLNKLLNIYIKILFLLYYFKKISFYFTKYLNNKKKYDFYELIKEIKFKKNTKDRSF